MSAETLQFCIDPQPGETQRARNAIVRASLPPSRRSAVMIGLYVVIVAVAFLLTPRTALQTVIVGVATVMATEGLLRWESNQRMRQLRTDDPHARETHYVELSDTGVHAWCGHIDMRYPWSDYRAFVQSPEFYLLLHAGGHGTAIPKRLLDAEGARELEAKLAAWLPDRAKT